jgi:hypothetical protein
MKTMIIALFFLAVFYLSGMLSNGNAAVQTTTVVFCGLVIVGYGMKVVCCACGQSDQPGCNKYRFGETQ